jgi:hypothetical protein
MAREEKEERGERELERRKKERVGSLSACM